MSSKTIINSCQCLLPFEDTRPDDPRIGILPPNNGTNGQGFVTYSILPAKVAITETRIDAVASIIFDENEPLDTLPIFNTVGSICNYLQ